MTETLKVYLLSLPPLSTTDVAGQSTRVLAGDKVPQYLDTDRRYKCSWKEVAIEHLRSFDEYSGVYRLMREESGWTRCTDDDLLALRVEDRLAK